jgi:ribonuclease HI
MVHPFFFEEEKEEPETEYVLRFGGYLEPNGNGAAAATIYKNRNAIRTEYMMVNAKVDPVEVPYHGLILGLNRLVLMKITDVKIEGNDYQVIENMEAGLRGHIKPVMRLHTYAESVAKQIPRIEYELINAHDNARVILICRHAVEKEYDKS